MIKKYSVNSTYQNFVPQNLLFWGSVFSATLTQQTTTTTKKTRRKENDFKCEKWPKEKSFYTHTHETFKCQCNFGMHKNWLVLQNNWVPRVWEPLVQGYNMQNYFWSIMCSHREKCPCGQVKSWSSGFTLLCN